MTTRRVAWRVTLDGRDLTDRIRPRLLDLTLTESRGDEADQLDLRIHDKDGRMEIPRKGVEITLAIGWEGTGLVEKGRFLVDEAQHEGTPDIITVRARSADLTAALRTRKERSWHGVTLGAILQQIAGEHGLQPRIAPELAGTSILHLDQAGESDANLLTRLGKRFDAAATVKAGALVFLKIGGGTTADGKSLPGFEITRRDGDRHRWAEADRDKYSGVRAYWHDKAGANRKSVLVGDSGDAKRLKATYNSEGEALQHARAEWSRLQRGAGTFAYTLALGRPELYPEMRGRVRGFGKPQIDEPAWLIAKVTHTITGSGGYTTAVEMETTAQESGSAEVLT